MSVLRYYKKGWPLGLGAWIGFGLIWIFDESPAPVVFYWALFCSLAPFLKAYWEFLSET